jgi:uncharacterized protein (DUF427 family)
MSQPKSLYGKYPDYRVDLVPGRDRVRVEFNGEVVADSRETLLVHEQDHEPVVYFPLRDVRSEWIEKTEHETVCPFKGEASYWSVRVGDEVAENTIWGYEDPFDEVSGLRGYVAFYRDPFAWSDGA